MSDQPLPPAQPTSPPSAVPTAPPMASLEDFQRIHLRVGTVVSAELHPNADRLLVLQVDLGTEKRQVVAGIRHAYEPSTLVGKQVIVVTNLKPAVLRGIESQGMALAASADATVALLTTDRPVPVGSLVK